MSRTVPGAASRQAIEKTRAEEDVGGRAGCADRHPPPARLEPRLRGVDERVREDEQQLEPGALDAPAVEAMEPVRELVDGDDGGAPEQEHQPAEPQLGRDDERRPVAAPPGRRTR